jgi:hypothetical protein
VLEVSLGGVDSDAMKSTLRFLSIILLVLGGAANFRVVRSSEVVATPYDLVLTNARVVDGSG